MSTATGRALVAAMRARQITQVQLASLLSVTQPTVSMWCRGHTKPQTKHWTRLQELLGIDPATWWTAPPEKAEESAPAAAAA